MALGNVMPDPKFTGLDNNGTPLSGGLVYFYSAGTSTPLDTYTTSALTVANANPVVLDSAGRATIYLSANAYKVILNTSGDALVWDQDNVQSLTLQQSVIGENLPMFGTEERSVNDTSYPSGTTADKLSPTTKILPLDSANATGTWALRGMLKTSNGAAGHGCTVGLVNLSDGSPDTKLVEITSSSTTGEIVTSTAITFATAGASKNYGVKLKSGNSATYVTAWGLELVRTA
jgi:hypothetical protein